MYSETWYRRQAKAVGLFRKEDIEDAMQEARLAVWQGKRVRWVLIDWLRASTKFTRTGKEKGKVREPLDRHDLLRFDYDIEGGEYLYPKVKLDEEAIVALVDVRKKLGSLTEKQLRAFLMRIDEGLSAAEIASKLGCTKVNIHSLLLKARRKLAA